MRRKGGKWLNDISEELPGVENPIWMVRSLLKTADSKMVKLAAVMLVDWLADQGDVEQLDIVDLLVQVTVTGRYVPRVEVPELDEQVFNEMFLDKGENDE